jgi:TatD DNase family protein
MNLILDSHAHYEDSAFDADRDKLLKTFPQRNVFAVINSGGDVESSKECIKLADEYGFCYASVGIHPTCLENTDIGSVQKMEELLEHKKVVAVGEIGLDYHYTDGNAAKQKKFFEEQIKLAMLHKLPVIVHDRDAHEDTVTILEKYAPAGVVHCFSGNVEMAERVIKLGMYVGIGGKITFKGSGALVDVVKNVPVEKILLETDAPYLSPVPFRGKRCESPYIKYVAEKIAEIKGTVSETILSVTKSNGIKLFGLEES